MCVCVFTECVYSVRNSINRGYSDSYSYSPEHYILARGWDYDCGTGTSVWLIGKFNPDNKSIAAYLKRVETYFSANKIPDDKKVHVAVFLNMLMVEEHKLC